MSGEQPNSSSSNSKKRKWANDSIRYGSKRPGGKGDKKRDLGRKEYNRQNVDKRERHEAGQDTRRQLHQPEMRDSVLPKPFPEEEVAAEERRPKHKVAVMIGYAGSGYKGMQINWSEKTIEGDLFHAFVKAGAISKANANDPKKSSLVRCARTDKGVHAAGNVISLKLIIQDSDVVEKINTHLPTQIRVWGIERTIGSFSCYQACDSRWYEYLIPSHCLLPPHPTSFLAKELEKAADEVDDRKGYEERQADVAKYWQSVEETDIKPILESLDENIQWRVKKALYQSEDEFRPGEKKEEIEEDNGVDARDITSENIAEVLSQQDDAAHRNGQEKAILDEATVPESMVDSGYTELSHADTEPSSSKLELVSASSIGPGLVDRSEAGPPTNLTANPPPADALLVAIKRLRSAYLTAKRRWRISASRVSRLQSALNAYEGTRNFYNYTIHKSGHDPSAKRHIKSFKVSPTPILRRGRALPAEDRVIAKSAEPADGNVAADEDEETEWLSLKVHGQSFMMHQIRKMVGMAVLAVRCGADAGPLIRRSYDWDAKLSIPKAPGLGLLLERPVFDSYNRRVEEKFKDRALIGFERYEKAMDEFKEREIYGRVFGEEQRDGVFHSFFSHVDNYREPYFLFVTSKGVEATKEAKYGAVEKEGKVKVADGIESEDEESEGEGAGGEGREG
ncbi:MAG: tRNA pseudouridine synthase 1 [Bathelium mastoideum]|nr:MAG: tRNA pseudouridine synthase 1 [Bathelium mastoideum]